MESQANMVAAAEPQSDTSSPRRLVIRVVLPEGSLQAPARPRLSKRALSLIAGSVAVLLLSWVGISMFGADPASTPARTASAPAPARSEAAPAVSIETPPQPAAETTSAAVAPRSTEAKPVESEAQQLSTAITKVLPDVPQSALDTIRGTVRVSVRVIVDKDGAVLGATADEPGPSRYFERLSLEASRKWTFPPAGSKEPRVMLLRFNYRRDGVTAGADSLQ